MNGEGLTTNLSTDRINPALAAAAAEEALVNDARAGLTPAQMVERKLFSMLRSAPVPVSRLQGAGPRRTLS
jgi:hypothetical protein